MTALTDISGERRIVPEQSLPSRQRQSEHRFRREANGVVRAVGLRDALPPWRLQASCLSVLVLVFLVAGRTLAAPVPISIGDGMRALPVPPRAQCLEDPSRQRSIDAVRGDAGWQEMQQRVLNFGLSHSDWWVRFTLDNARPTPFDAILDLGTAHQDSVDWYIFTQDGGVSQKLCKRPWLMVQRKESFSLSWKKTASWAMIATGMARNDRKPYFPLHGR